jgi:hypothetical protein
VPVLTTDKVNIWREISADEAGLIESDDLSGTVRALEHWCALDLERRNVMRGNALRCFQSRFEILNFTDRLTAYLTTEIGALLATP